MEAPFILPFPDGCGNVVLFLAEGIKFPKLVGKLFCDVRRLSCLNLVVVGPLTRTIEPFARAEIMAWRAETMSLRAEIMSGQ